MITQVVPLTATLDDIAHARSERKHVVQYATQVIEPRRDKETCAVCITEGRLPVAPRGL